MKTIKSIQNFGSLFFLMALIGVYSCVDDVDPIDTETETAIPIAELVSIKLINPIDTLVISNIHKYKVEGFYSDSSVKDLSDSVMVLALSNSITKIDSSSFTTGKSGPVKVKVVYKEKYVLEDEFHSYEIESIPIDYKFNSIGNCTIEVPTVLINLLPTYDGINHDEERGQSGYGGLYYPTLDVVKTKIYGDLAVTKRIVEMGTMYRDYGRKQVNPYACIKVVKIVNVYEWQLKSYILDGIMTLDYHDLFKRLDMENLMNETSFKEVWITHFPNHKYPSMDGKPYTNPYWEMPESNMSSPVTGDVSNSYPIKNELPLYKSTYVVYGHNAHRGVDTNLHNRGHQIERQMRYIQQTFKHKLFDNNFIGANSDDKTRKNARCGDTHFPPNAKSAYDYRQSESFLSDIKTWKPEGGAFEYVNSDTWTSIDYSSYDLKTVHFDSKVGDYNNNPDAKWHLFWFQSIPGKANNILYKYNGLEYTITNWWDIFFNWDDAIKAKKNLYE